MSNNTQKVYQILTKIFGGVELASLKAFFINVIRWNVDVVVFTTRRSHLLYCLFKKYVINTQEFKLNNYSKEKKYITDKAIHFYHKEISNKTILVVDDILVHGRALTSVVEKISQCEPRKIEQYVFAQSKNITTKAEDKAKHICKITSKKGELEDYEWKRLSNQIVAALILSSVPYASYVFSINREMEELEFKQFVDEFKNVFIKDINQDYLLDLSLNEYENNSNLTKIINENIYAYIFPVDPDYKNSFSYIRLYYNKITKKCIVMPFYFMSSYTEKELDILSSQLFTKPIFKSANKELIYRALTAYYSLFIFKNNSIRNIINKYNDWDTSKEIIEQSYYKGFFDEIIEMLKTDSSFPQRKSLIQEEKQFNSYIALDNKQQPILVDVYLKEFIKITKSFNVNCEPKNHSTQTVFLHNYLKNVNEQEENYIELCVNTNQKAQKQEGLSFEFVEFFVNNSLFACSLTDILSKTISGADSGLITISPNKFKMGNDFYFSNFLITGEQVCRLYQDEILIFLLNLKYLLDLSAYECSLEDFLKSNIENISHNKLKIEKILEYSKKLINVDVFTVNNIYEKIYDKELKVFLEKFM